MVADVISGDGGQSGAYRGRGRAVRILLLADSHLGFDLPLRPRVRRRRRGHDFQANHEAALEPALRGEVDVVVHGGDVFHRSRVAESLAWQGLAPLVRVAEAGVPVVVVPGNHERSRIPHARFVRHPRVHVLDRPRRVELEVRGERLRFFGFPFERGDIRSRFPELIRRTGWRPASSSSGDGGSIDLLCMHQCFEGATVGPSDFTFTTGRDVVRAADLPAGVTAVLSGHIHRHQVLTRDLRGAPLRAPVLYPGSVERTSVAEKDETKGYLLLEVEARAEAEQESGGARLRWRFVPLPARPFVVRELDVDGLAPAAVDGALRGMVAAAPRDAVLRVRVLGTPSSPESRRLLSAAHVRTIAPASMNVELRSGGIEGVAGRKAREPSGVSRGSGGSGGSGRAGLLQGVLDL